MLGYCVLPIIGEIKKMKVFITGATGFIGGYLVRELLNHEYQIKILSRNKSKTLPGTEQVIGDITKPESFSEALQDIDVVFHNAAYAMDHGVKNNFYAINVQGTRNVAEACVKNGIDQLIYTSTAGIYGYPKQGTIITEDTPKNPLNVYQKTKWLGEVSLKDYDTLRVSAIRPPLVFGPGSPALKIAFEKLSKQKFPFIGSGEQLLPIVHPADVARCMRTILEKDTQGDVFNVVGFQVSIKKFLNTIAEKTHISPPKKHVPYALAYTASMFSEFFTKDPNLTRFRVKSLGCTRIISADKANKILGFTPVYDFEKTVDDIVNWCNRELR
jgi:2-alkyl-3-oxoalkanoate reductase